MLLRVERSLLMIVDMQTSLAATVADAEACIRRARFLVRAARTLAVPMVATEQYPERLGPTVAPLREEIEGPILAKLEFAASADPAVRDPLLESGRDQIVVVGMEAHVCVLQTAIGLRMLGRAPVVVADAVASRNPVDRDLALVRLQGAGIPAVTSEMVVFEWLARAGTPAFKALLPMIRDEGVR